MSSTSDTAANEPRLLNLSTLQKALIHELINEKIGVVLNLDFNDTAEDQLRLRQHAFLKGAIKQLVEILEYDETRRQQAEENLSAAVDAAAPQQQTF